MAEVNVWVSMLDLRDGVATVIEVVDFSRAHPIVITLVLSFGVGRNIAVATDKHVDYDVTLVADDLLASLDSRLNVGVPGCHTIDEDMALEVLRWENSWYG